MPTDLERIQGVFDRGSDFLRRGARFSKKYLKKSAEVTKNSALKARPLTDREKFQLSKIEELIHKDDFNKVSNMVKQSKARIVIERKGWSFLISSKDLLPRVAYISPSNRKYVIDKSNSKKESNYISRLNKKIEDMFFEERFKEFSERAWGFIPQFIAPTLVAPLYIKQSIALQFFCPEKLKLLIVGGENNKKLFKSAKEIDSSIVFSDLNKLSVNRRKRILSSRKLLATSKNNIASFQSVFNLSLASKKIDMAKFTDIVENLVVQEVKINKNDVEFIKRYVKYAKTIEAKIPSHLIDKIKSFAINLKKKNKNISKNSVEGLLQLTKASAMMELRDHITNKDLARVFKLYRRI